MPFREIIGHRRLVGLLARSVRRDSVPPSLIFAGPPGIGKRLTALATAQALNCTAPIIDDTPDARGRGDPRTIVFDACGRCAACVRIARGAHADVIVVEPGESGSIKTEQVRDVIDRSGYRPFEGRRRVVIIDQADALVATAQNALLKTLEEPPSSSLFMLVTARADSLLPTVLSRCPRLRFRPIPPDDIASVLRQRGKSEDEARTVAALSDGSLGRALDMSASDVAEARAIAQEVLAGAGANDDPRRRLDWAKALLTKSGSTAAGERTQLAAHLRAMASLLRDAELLSAGADNRTLANPDMEPALDRLATVYGGERGVRAFSAIDEALVALDRNAGVKIVADWIVLHL